MAPQTVLKRAETDEERRRLGIEATVLDEAAHPGLVRLVAVEWSSPGQAAALTTARADGGCLAELGRQPVQLLAGWAVAVATILGDLHALGWAHGAVRAEHVVLDDGGRPQLCGLGMASRLADATDPAAAPRRDLIALAQMLCRLAPAGRETDRLGRRLSRWERSVGRRRPPAADALIRVILSCVGDARVDLPLDLERTPAETATQDQPEPRPRPRLRPRPTVIRRFWWAPVAALTMAGVGIWWLGGRGSASPRAAAPAGNASVALGPSGSANYALVTPAAGRALTVLGRWGCGPELPAVLYLGDGEVWVFDHWPTPGSPLDGRLVEDVRGATGLAVADASGSCDRLVVLRATARPLTVEGAVG